MKILVLGAAGMAGHTISIYFKEQGHDVAAYTRSPFSLCKNIVGDALNEEDLKKSILSDQYDSVINCIGILNKAAEDNPSQAVYLNSYLPHLIADTLRETKTKLIHLSTDCVFAGNKAPYSEYSLRDGHTFYDRTKALGEIEDDKNLTFRTSIVGPDINEMGIGLFNWFMKQKKATNGYTGAIWTGVTTLTLAKAMEQALKENLTGLFNLVNNESISKYELLKLFNKYFCGNNLDIIPSNSLNLDKSLICTRKNEFSFRVPSYEQMILEMKDWIIDHQQLYSSYGNFLYNSFT